MKIKRKLVTAYTLERFADEHDLTLLITERIENHLPRYYVQFKDVSLRSGPIIRGVVGEGNTEQEAINDYREKISMQYLTIKTHTKHQYDVTVPILIDV